MYYPKDFKDVLLDSGITAQEFPDHHHQRKSLKTHLNYCLSHNTYRAGGNNQALHAKVAAMAKARADRSPSRSG